MLSRGPESIYKNGRPLSEILKRHQEWLSDHVVGQRANLSDALLCQARLAGVDLRQCNLRRAVLDGADLTRAVLRGANLDKALLHGATLQNANATRAKLHGAKITCANAQGIKLSQADLSNASLCGTDLRRAQLVRANLRGADLSDTDLRDANLRHVLLSHKTILAGSQLTRAKLYGMQTRGEIDWNTEWMGSDPDKRTFGTHFPEGGPAGWPKFVCLLVGI
jgi:uncharacterized protein YjbI with pentapeptide repeats